VDPFNLSPNTGKDGFEVTIQVKKGDLGVRRRKDWHGKQCENFNSTSFLGNL